VQQSKGPNIFNVITRQRFWDLGPPKENFQQPTDQKTGWLQELYDKKS